MFAKPCHGPDHAVQLGRIPLLLLTLRFKVRKNVMCVIVLSRRSSVTSCFLVLVRFAICASYLMMTSTCRKPKSDFQSRFNTLTQISPVLDTFGWNILVKKYPTSECEPVRPSQLSTLDHWQGLAGLQLAHTM